MTPYNTGKVKIGSGLTYTQRPYHDADACRLQAALLDKPSTTKAFAAFFACCAAAIGFAALIVHHLSK